MFPTLREMVPVGQMIQDVLASLAAYLPGEQDKQLEACQEKNSQDPFRVFFISFFYIYLPFFFQDEGEGTRVPLVPGYLLVHVGYV